MVVRLHVAEGGDAPANALRQLVERSQGRSAARPATRVTEVDVEVAQPDPAGGQPAVAANSGCGPASPRRCTPTGVSWTPEPASRSRTVVDAQIAPGGVTSAK